MVEQGGQGRLPGGGGRNVTWKCEEEFSRWPRVEGFLWRLGIRNSL